MTDIWDLSAYVEAHPGDLDQRWRLAKKLYTAFEYRLALEHLLVLKNEWGPRANVSRYLAATYFRLGRYEEAIREMRNSLDKFPEDMGLREQLARTLVTDDQNEAAVKEWEEILKLRPDHAFAGQAVEKLKKTIEKRARAQAKVEQAKTGTALNANALDTNPNEVSCPSCGELNSSEFKRCWKCHALLGTETAPPSAFVEPPKAAPAQVRWPIAMGILIAGMLALGVFLTLRGLSTLTPGISSDSPPPSVIAYLDRILFWTKVSVGVALLIGWPIAWRLGSYFAEVEGRIYNDTLYQYGALLALSTYALLWLPWRWVVAAAAVPLVASALIAFLALSIRPGAAARLWLIQLVAVAVLATGVISLRHGPGILIEAPAIAAYASKSNEASTYASRLSAPGEIRVVWASSGSRWFDRHGSSVEISVRPAPHSRPLYLETIKPEAEGPPTYEHMRGEVFTSRLDAVRPGARYTYKVQTKELVAVDFTLQGLLRPSVELVPYEAVLEGS